MYTYEFKSPQIVQRSCVCESPSIDYPIYSSDEFQPTLPFLQPAAGYGEAQPVSCEGVCVSEQTFTAMNILVKSQQRFLGRCCALPYRYSCSSTFISHTNTHTKDQTRTNGNLMRRINCCMLRDVLQIYIWVTVHLSDVQKVWTPTSTSDDTANPDCSIACGNTQFPFIRELRRGWWFQFSALHVNRIERKDIIRHLPK